MITYEWYRSGSIFGIQYRIPEGRALKRHAHDAETAHNVIVLEGAVQFDSEELRCMVVSGEVLDFDGSKPHEITALEGGALILNLFLNGMPEQYKTLPESEHSGAF